MIEGDEEVIYVGRQELPQDERWLHSLEHAHVDGLDELRAHMSTRMWHAPPLRRCRPDARASPPDVCSDSADEARRLNSKGARR